MNLLTCTAWLAATLALAGCTVPDLFGEFDLPEGPEVAAAPYPRLVDVPEAPPAGTYTDAVPDPATGAETERELTVRAVAADVRAAELSGPVISEAERAAMRARARRTR